MFGALTLYGSTTRRSLAGAGQAGSYAIVGARSLYLDFFNLFLFLLRFLSDRRE